MAGSGPKATITPVPPDQLLGIANGKMEGIIVFTPSSTFIRISLLSQQLGPQEVCVHTLYPCPYV